MGRTEIVDPIDVVSGDYISPFSFSSLLSLLLLIITSSKALRLVLVSGSMKRRLHVFV